MRLHFEVRNFQFQILAKHSLHELTILGSQYHITFVCVRVELSFIDREFKDSEKERKRENDAERDGKRQKGTERDRRGRKKTERDRKLQKDT